ncbi:putative antirepressor [Butyrivibrio virus Ceridwen]|nr:putative antirepressor [Butyrivibrio virus Ceridwen]
MNELTSFNFDTQTVSARELHEKLSINSNFTTWFNRMTEYGFTEGTDFFPKMEESTGGRPSMDYEISMDMAKEICMIQRTPEGKKVREYLLNLEKAWNTPELVFARALKASEKLLAEAQEKVKLLEYDNEVMKPKALFADSVAASDNTILIGELAKIIKANGVDMGQNRLFAWLRDNGYLIRRKGTDYNMPTQRAMELGLFKIKETTINKPDGSVAISKTVKVTGKGQQYFINKFLGEAS